jgi:hypothetical protein
VIEMNLQRILLIVLVIMAAACAKDSNEFDLSTHTFDFSQSEFGWSAGFSDYPVLQNDSPNYELQYKYTPCPATAGNSIMVSGNNHSDDLFIFIKKQLSGLEPNASYLITYQVELASDAKEGEVGVGGAPGDAVYLKAGASSVEPKSLIEEDEYVMNIDKGNQSQGGSDMVVIGNIAAPADANGYVLISRSNTAEASNAYNTPIVAKTNNKGELWLIVGTDSAFEGVTTIYYSVITVVLSRSH